MSVLPAVPAEAQPALDRSRLRWSVPPAAKRLLREPLLHFLLLGLALFVVYGYRNRGRLGIEPSRQIVLSLDDLRIMETYFESAVASATDPAGVSDDGGRQRSRRGLVPRRSRHGSG